MNSLRWMQDLTIPVAGGEINVWHRPATGEAETAILAHGLTGNSRWWARVIDMLPPEVGVAALDIRGRGGSSSTPPPYGLKTLADDVAATLDHLGLATATIAGYSMGAWIAAIFAIRQPGRVGRLVLLDGGLEIPVDPDADPDSVIAAMVGPALARLDVDFANEESFFDYWKAHPALERHWDDAMRAALGHELASGPDGLRVRVSPQAVSESARQITVDPDTKNAAAHVMVPAHLIVVERGTADQPGGMIPRQTAEEAAAANPNLTIEYLDGLNHYTLVLGEGAAEVARAITAAS